MRKIIQSIPFISIAFFLGTLIYFDRITSSSGSGTITYYATLIFQPIESLGRWILVMVLMGLIFYLIWSFLKLSLKGASFKIFISQTAGFTNEAKYFGKYMVPVLICLILLSFILPHMNQINSVRLKDEALMNIDLYLTGAYPFLYFASFPLPDWFVQTIVFLFENFALILLAGAMYIFFSNKLMFQKFSAAFCLALIFAFLLWLKFPAISPHDRFIDNVYELPVAYAISGEIIAYNPPPYVKQFLADVRIGKEKSNLPYLPTSTMPSSHIIWAVLLGYFIFRTNLVAGLITLPLLILSSFGTVFLAQHYFIDILVGMIVSGVAIAIISFCSPKNTP